MAISLSLSPVTHSELLSGGANAAIPFPSSPWQVWQVDAKRLIPAGNCFLNKLVSFLTCLLLILAIVFLSCIIMALFESVMAVLIF